MIGTALSNKQQTNADALVYIKSFFGSFFSKKEQKKTPVYFAVSPKLRTARALAGFMSRMHTPLKTSEPTM